MCQLLDDACEELAPLRLRHSMRLNLSEPLPLEPSREGEKEVIELTAALNGASHRTIRTSYTTTR